MSVSVNVSVSVGVSVSVSESMSVSVSVCASVSVSVSRRVALTQACAAPGVLRLRYEGCGGVVKRLGFWGCRV